MKHTIRISALLLSVIMLFSSLTVFVSATENDTMVDPATGKTVPCTILNDPEDGAMSMARVQYNDAPTVKRGDLNGNGEIDSNDAASLRTAFLTWDGVTGAAQMLASADVNVNEKLDSNDYILIRLDVLGISPIDPPPPEDKYATDYGYTYLATFQNGTAMQTLYDQLAEVSLDFHTSETWNAADDVLKLRDQYGTIHSYYSVTSASLTKLGLTSNEAYAVWSIFKYDHPLYYWISSSSCCGSDRYGNVYFYLLTEAEFTAPAVRSQTNAVIYQTTDEIVQKYADETEPYRIALAIHDEICDKIDYAYEPDGATPSGTLSAHSIYGFFADDEGVCECYAKTFELFMNYYGIQNILVTNETHAFNLICLDGGWYWVDVTFDDMPNWGEGKVHFFFCVNDTDNVYRDFPQYGSESFLQFNGHEIIAEPTVDSQITYILPARAQKSYSCNAVMIGDTFQNGRYTYMISGYRYARPTPYYSNVTYPDTLTYLGREYIVPKR